MDFLEYSDISAEIKGANVAGKVKFTDQHIIFKNNKTGKVDQIVATDIDVANWHKLVGSWALRLFLKNGNLHRYTGFRESDQEKVSKFFKTNYKHDTSEKELCLKGWNWGTARFQGSVLSFDVGSYPSFEIPLNNVSQCTPGKNEVTIEYHQNDDAPVNLVEMRFHIPSSEIAGGDDPVDSFHQQVMKNASVINVSGDAIAIFREIQCLTPRGRYDIKVFQTFFQLHGKTFDYKIPVSTVLRLFILPHKDGRQMFFVVSLDPPIKQGQTRYHFLTFLFSIEETMSIELPFSDEELKDKFEGKLSKELSGHTYEVMGKVMKAIVNRKITVPGNFIGHSGTSAIGCSYKAAAGYMYPLERGFIYVHKPPIHLRYEEITSVNFARSGSTTRSFDFEVELKSGVVHTFSSIEKEEYTKLWDFISKKNLRVKNSGKPSKQGYADDAFSDSENEDEPDAYLARVKAEAKERDEDGGEDDESTDEDFVPGEMPDDDNSAGSGTSDDSDGGSDASADSPKKKEKKPVKEKEEKPKKEKKPASEKPTKRRQKKEKDDNRPKRPQTAFMLWLNETRKSIVEDNPGIKVTEVAKKGGELWKELKDKSEWEAKATKLKEEYTEAMKEYTASGGSSAAASSKKESGAKKPSKSKVSAVSPSKVVSKEYISDDDSSSDDDKPAKKESKKPEKKSSKKKSSSEEEESSESEGEPPSKKKANGKKKPKDEDDDDEEEAETTPSSGDDSD
ncbi:hypothetical protein FOCC_FOCC000266 [Frankliniella occidentalis]|uniref:FACT complex subunit SSRP1 n=1 Tax=Frankliniella occidentalis TaxID=133901 RepID=A0A6J1SA86_FRAOC|nr:FACT complex subunit Ssrp1 [Frankliniella occidentalis]KAE8752921.1 hypothetical protein FOCC_FOCC000266 [Frankliniella occidentalis]